MPIGRLKVGDIVVWTSSSNGSTTQKTGVVEHVIPVRARLPQQVVNEMRGAGGPRDDESYVVRVGKTAKAKGKLYWPMPNKLVKTA